MSYMKKAQIKRLLYNIGFQNNKTVLDAHRVDSQRCLSKFLVFLVIYEFKVDFLHKDLHIVQKAVDDVPKIATIVWILLFFLSILFYQLVLKSHLFLFISTFNRLRLWFRLHLAVLFRVIKFLYDKVKCFNWNFYWFWKQLHYGNSNNEVVIFRLLKFYFEGF